MEELSWENVISANKIQAFNAGCHLQLVNDWVRAYTNFDFFCFNGIVYRVRTGYSENTGFILDNETRCFVKSE